MTFMLLLRATLTDLEVEEKIAKQKLNDHLRNLMNVSSFDLAFPRYRINESYESISINMKSNDLINTISIDMKSKISKIELLCPFAGRYGRWVPMAIWSTSSIVLNNNLNIYLSGQREVSRVVSWAEASEAGRTARAKPVPRRPRQGHEALQRIDRYLPLVWIWTIYTGGAGRQYLFFRGKEKKIYTKNMFLLIIEHIVSSKFIANYCNEVDPFHFNGGQLSGYSSFRPACIRSQFCKGWIFHMFIIPVSNTYSHAIFLFSANFSLNDSLATFLLFIIFDFMSHYALSRREVDPL